MTPAPVVIIGQGNDYRGDDGAGPEVIRRLKGLKLDVDYRLDLIAGPLDMADIIERWQNTALTIFVDAVFSQGPPGKIHVFHPLVSPLPEEWGTQISTHDAPPVTQALELGRALNHLPHKLVVYCIEGHDFAHKAGLNPPVEQAVSQVVDMISKELQMFHSETRS